MKFKAHKPQSLVGNFVELIWYAEADQMFSGSENILPDGSVQIIINLGPAQYLVDEKSKQAFQEGWITGQRTRPIEVEVTSSYKAVGIRFNSTGIFSFLGFPAAELTDKVVELNDIWNNEFSFLRDRLLDTTNTREKFLIIENFLIYKLQNKEQPHAAVAYLTELLQQSRSELSIREAIKKINISHKHLIRLFKKHVGISPKLYQRIFRFQYALEAINKSDVEFSEILGKSDYFDQPHFNHEFKQFSGFTPREYLAMKKADNHTLILE